MKCLKNCKRRNEVENRILEGYEEKKRKGEEKRKRGGEIRGEEKRIREDCICFFLLFYHLFCEVRINN